MAVLRRGTSGAHLGLPALALILAGCDGSQSTLAPSGEAAGEIAALWWWMFWAATAIFLVVMAFLLFSMGRHPAKRRRLTPYRTVIIGGIVFPVVALSALLVLGINVGSGMYASLPNDALTIRVTAYQWWWEFEYLDEDSVPVFTTANEIHLPVGEPVELLLEAGDVIHSFWLPRLAGKLDLIPGTTNRLVIEAEEAGTFRGQCAEYCGEAHAMMAFFAVAVPPDEFSEWAEKQHSPQTAATAEHPGAALFKANGCGLCHTVRGHGSLGREAPELTHVGSRRTIGAGLMLNTPLNIAHWLGHNNELKPGNRMPEYDHLNLGQRLAIADYLESLE